MRRNWCLGGCFLLLAFGLPQGADRASAQPPALPDGAAVRLGSPNLRAGGRVNGIVVFDGGKRLATLADDELVVWETATGRPLSSEPLAASISPARAQFAYPDGFGLAVAADGKSLVSVRAGRVSVHALPVGSAPPVLLPDISADEAVVGVLPVKGGGVVAVSSAGSFREWQPGDRTWTRLDLLNLGKSPGFAGGGRFAAVVERESRVRVWDVEKGKEVGDVTPGRIVTTTVAADGKSLLTVCRPVGDSKFSVAEMRSLPERNQGTTWEVPAVRAGRSVAALSADGTRAAIAAAGRLGVYDTATGKLRHTLRPANQFVQHLSFLPDGGLVSVTRSGIIEIWDGATGRPRFPESGHMDGVLCVARGANGACFTGDRNGLVLLWDAAGKIAQRFEGHGREVSGLVTSADGKTLYSASLDNDVREWDVATGKERHQLSTQTGLHAAHGLVASPDGKLLAVSGGSGRVHLIDTAEFKVVKTLTPEPKPVTGGTPALAFPAADTLVTRDNYGAINVWSLGPKDECRQIKADHELKWDFASRFAFAVSPDGKTTVAAVVAEAARPNFAGPRRSNELAVWDIKSGKLVERIKTDAQRGITATAYLPDGKAVVVGDADGTVWVIDLEAKKVRHTFKGHRGPVLCLAASPDGKTLTSGGADTTALVWKLDPK